MNAKLFLSISQHGGAAKPYTFKMTNINVYTFEEALYHCYAYWKQSVDDFCGEEFIAWVTNELNLSVIASQIRELAPLLSFSEKYTAFLTISGYLDENDIKELKQELLAWEKRLEWEKFKERGDYLINNSEYEKANIMYKKAITCNPDNPLIYNNAAIALMKLGLYGEAAGRLKEALRLDGGNVKIMLHLAEALLLNGEYDNAREILRQAGEYGENSDISCFYGQIEYYSGNYVPSITYFEAAIKAKPEAHYIYCLSDVYVKLRQYDKAIATMNLVQNKGKVYLKKLADLYVTYNDIPKAIKCIEKALITDNTSVDLWTRLASYHRQDYDINRANSAIVKALSISKNNPKAKLEYARIRKAQGRIRDYQVILNDVLGGFKESYRENMSME